MNKEELVSIIKDWIEIEKEITKINSELKQKRTAKKEFNEKIIVLMKQHQVEALNMSGGSILYKKTTGKKSLNKQSMVEILGKYFANKEVNVEELTKYMFDNREEKITESIKMKLDK